MASRAKDIDDAGFRAWLEAETGLGSRAVSDTVSRARRASRLIDLVAGASPGDLRYRLEQRVEFQSCSASVKSQLKRAATLYREFADRRGDSDGL